MLRPHIALLEEIHPKAKAILEEVTKVEEMYHVEGEFYHYNKPQDIVFNKLKPLKTNCIVGCPCTSVEHIISPKIIYLDDEWKRTEGLKITSTAEHTFSLILQLAKMNKMQLSGKTLGIIGYGRIGRMVDHYAEAFEMIVHESDKDSGWPLDKMLPICDVITIHIPLEGNKGFIGEEEFAMMKDGALVVNTSRAEVVDEKALIDALLMNDIGGYADDFQNSHSEDMLAIWKYSRKPIILTPHIAGSTKEAREATDIYIANKIKEYINGYS